MGLVKKTYKDCLAKCVCFVRAVFCFDKKVCEVKLNEVEMCSLVAACTRHDINCENLTVFVKESHFRER